MPLTVRVSEPFGPESSTVSPTPTAACSADSGAERDLRRRRGQTALRDHDIDRVADGLVGEQRDRAGSAVRDVIRCIHHTVDVRVGRDGRERRLCVDEVASTRTEEGAQFEGLAESFVSVRGVGDAVRKGEGGHDARDADDGGDQGWNARGRIPCRASRQREARADPQCHRPARRRCIDDRHPGRRAVGATRRTK